MGYEVDKIRVAMSPRISLINAALCIQQSRTPEPDNVCEIKEIAGDIDADVLKPFLLALGEGSLRAEGYLARVRIDVPEFKGDAHDDVIQKARELWRASADFELGLAQEDSATAVPPTLWSRRTVIWERSTVWIMDPQQCFRNRCKTLKPFPAESEDPPQPFEREEALCFREVSFAVDELTAALVPLAATSQSNDASSPVKNPRKAGRRAQGHWEIIAPHLREQIATSPAPVWESWSDLMAAMEQYVRVSHHKTSLGGSEKAFKEWLRVNDGELLENLRKRIKTSRIFAC